MTKEIRNKGSTHEGGKDDERIQAKNYQQELEMDNNSSENSSLTDHSLEHKFHQNNLYAI